ncbi:MAG: FHA domain-containing protein [Archangium sp.]|nr:FHA domain-containing protein [Archangium sp.]
MTTSGEAEDFSFEGGEARLGRTADNDIVIKDPSSSRSHARVYEEEGRHFVEDLKSANGTKLNGKPVKAPIELKSGDKVSIGDVVLEFDAPAANDTVMGNASSTMDDGGAEPPAEEEDPNATMLKPPQKPAAIIRNKPPAARRPDPEPEEEPQDEAPAEEEEEVAASANSTKNFNVPPPKAMARRATGANTAPVRSRPPREEEGDGEEVQLTAAERARQRRALAKSGSGRAQLLWSDLSLPAKIVVGGVGGIAVVAMLGLAVMAVIPKKVNKKFEVAQLAPNGDPVFDSFGLGDDVDFEKPDMKSFTFQYDSPTSIVGVLHYQARDCSKEEVSIELNGNALGTIPPDTIEVNQRQLEVVLPATQLKVSEPNELVFDNVNNPPGEDLWKIWNIWVEVIPIPNMTGEEASRRAKQDIERAASMYDQRDIGAMNLFRAWKSYRDAWLLLEATPDRSAELLQIARTRMREIRPELDRKCSALLVDYQKEMAKKEPNVGGARKVLQNIPSYFEKEHPCFGMARGLLRSMDDLTVEGE